MPPENLLQFRKLRRQLNRVIDEEIAESQRQRHASTVEIVYAAVKKRASQIVQQILDLVCETFLRNIIQKRFKRVVVEPTEEEKEMREAQATFEGMEEFRGCDKLISYEDRPHIVVYVALWKSNQTERALALALLDQSMTNDAKRRDRLAAAIRYLDGLAKLYGDLPAWQLVQKHRQNGAAVG